MAMIFNFIQHNWQYGLLIISIALFVNRFLQDRKLTRLFNSGRVPDIMRAEQNKTLSEVFAVLTIITFLIVMI